MPTPRVWRAGPDEAEHVARLIVAFRDHIGRDWPSENAFLAGVERLMEDGAAVYLLASPDDDSPPAGVAQLRFRYGLWWAAEDCLLEDLFVAGSARGAGLGRALLDATVGLARERGCRRIELDTDEGNAPAMALYESVGFRWREENGGRSIFMRLHL